VKNKLGIMCTWYWEKRERK